MKSMKGAANSEKSFPGKNPVLSGEVCGVSESTNGMSALLAGQQTKTLNPQLGGQANSLKGFQGLKEGFDRLAA